MDLYGAVLENITQGAGQDRHHAISFTFGEKGLHFLLQSHDELLFAVPDAAVKRSALLFLK